MYNDNPTSRTFLGSLCFYLIKTRPPLFNSAIKQTVWNRWGEPTSWSATIWGVTFPDLLPFGASFFPPKAFLIVYGSTAFKIWLKLYRIIDITKAFPPPSHLLNFKNHNLFSECSLTTGSLYTDLVYLWYLFCHSFIEKKGGNWSGEKTPYPQFLDTGRRTTPQVACIPILFIFIYFAFIIFVLETNTLYLLCRL